jgi:rhodanese-related sulfurtransferase
VQQLAPESLAAFLRAHEDALLVDVREACESDAGSVHLHGREAQAVPLSRLAEHLGHFLAAPRRPLVFVCRSGNRSARAALCLQRLGHAQAWSLPAASRWPSCPILPACNPANGTSSAAARCAGESWRTRDKRSPAGAASRYTSVIPACTVTSFHRENDE